jgi:hypothetical protein
MTRRPGLLRITNCPKIRSAGSGLGPTKGAFAADMRFGHNVPGANIRAILDCQLIGVYRIELPAKCTDAPHFNGGVYCPRRVRKGWKRIAIRGRRPMSRKGQLRRFWRSRRGPLIL